MRKNELVLDKISTPQNHALFISMQIYEFTESELHINDLVKRVLRKRKQARNVNDEARILKSIGLLIGLGKLSYYKGYIYRT